MSDTVINDFIAYMRKCGGNWYDWYVGIAEDPKLRLFTDHNVAENGGIWIYSQNTGSDSIARNIEQYLLDQGCDGGPGGGSSLSRFVYAYRKTAYTNENN